MLDALRDRPDRAGVLLDFDGSLSPIVSRPELALPLEGTSEVLASLVARLRLVAIVSGRPPEELVERVGVDGLTYEGLYGIADVAPDLTRSLLPRAESAASVVPQAWVEDKRVSLAVHYRQAPDPVDARRLLVAALHPVAIDGGMELVEGKMVLELVPADRPMKGGVVERLVGAHDLGAVLFAGDDVADLDAFAALDRLVTGGVATVKVAVVGPETPQPLLDAADIRVQGPEGLLELLRSLVAPA